MAPLSNRTSKETSHISDSLTEDVCAPYASRSSLRGQVASPPVQQTVVPGILPLAVLGPLLSALIEEAEWALVRMRKTEGMYWGV